MGIAILATQGGCFDRAGYHRETSVQELKEHVEKEILAEPELAATRVVIESCKWLARVV